MEKSTAIEKTASDFDNANLKVKKIRGLIECGIYDADIARYIPGMLDLIFQGIIEKIMATEQPVDSSYKDEEVLDFELILDNNFYTNLKSLHICFSIHFKKLSNAAANLDADIYPVNIFFLHWVKKINTLKYDTNQSLIPTTTTQEIYQYSDSMLKHLPKSALKMIQNDLLHSENPVIIVGGNDSQIHNNDNEILRTDKNLESREDKFGAQIDSKYIYRLPLKYFCEDRLKN